MQDYNHFLNQTISLGQNQVRLLKIKYASPDYSVYETDSPDYCLKLIFLDKELPIAILLNNANALSAIKAIKQQNFCHLQNIIAIKKIDIPIANKQQQKIGLILLPTNPQGCLLDFLTQYDKKQIPEYKIIRIIQQICLALQKIHENNFIFCNLSLQNVQFTKTGKVCLSNYDHFIQPDKNGQFFLDLLKLKESTTEFHYYPPELFNGAFDVKLASKIDSWSVGVLLFCLCYQTLPFHTILDIIKNNQQKPAIQSQYSFKYSEQILEMLKNLICGDANQRWSIDNLVKYIDYNKQSLAQDSAEQAIFSDNARFQYFLQNIDQAKSSLFYLHLTGNQLAVGQNSNSNSNSKNNINQAKKTQPLAQPVSLNQQSYNSKSNTTKSPLHEYQDKALELISKNQSQIRPNFISSLEKTYSRLTKKTEGWILSAIEENEERPKQKYIRQLIMKSWYKSAKINKFYSLICQKMMKCKNKTVIILKSLILLHDYIMKGARDTRDLDSIQANPVQVLQAIEHNWGQILLNNTQNSLDRCRSEPLSQIIFKYTKFLIVKFLLGKHYLNFFEGNFSLNYLFERIKENQLQRQNSKMQKNKMQIVIEIKIFTNLLKYLRQIMDISDYLFAKRVLFNIQCSLCLVLIQEINFLVKFYSHLIYATLKIFNYVLIDQIDKEKFISFLQDLFQEYKEMFNKCAKFIQKARQQKEFKDELDMIQELDSRLILTIEKRIGEVLNQVSNTHEANPLIQSEFKLIEYLNPFSKVAGIELPMSYGPIFNAFTNDQIDDFEADVLVLNLEQFYKGKIKQNSKVTIEPLNSINEPKTTQSNSLKDAKCISPQSQQKLQQPQLAQLTQQQIQTATNTNATDSNNFQWGNVFDTNISNISTFQKEVNLLDDFENDSDNFKDIFSSPMPMQNVSQSFDPENVFDSFTKIQYSDQFAFTLNATKITNDSDNKQQLNNQNQNQVAKYLDMDLLDYGTVQSQEIDSKKQSAIKNQTNDAQQIQQPAIINQITNQIAIQQNQNFPQQHGATPSQEFEMQFATNETNANNCLASPPRKISELMKQGQSIAQPAQLPQNQTQSNEKDNFSPTLKNQFQSNQRAQNEKPDIIVNSNQIQNQFQSNQRPQNEKAGINVNSNQIQQTTIEIVQASKQNANANDSMSFMEEFKDCLIPFKELKIGDLIGYGASSKVYHGQHLGKDIAIKEIFINEMKPDLLKQFKREIRTLHSTSAHQNLVKFLGISVSTELKSNILYIITEYCSGGTLFELLQEKLDIDLSWKQRIQFALDIANGMSHLHKFQLIHRDLKSNNLLLDKDIKKGPAQIKISDFGLTRIQNIDTIMTGFQGTVHWMAPEFFESKPYTISADIYSYAIVLWEICTRQVPYNNFDFPVGIMMHVIKQGRPDLKAIPKDCPQELIQLIQSCWKQDPNQRPNFDFIIQQLQNIQNSKDNNQ